MLAIGCVRGDRHNSGTQSGMRCDARLRCRAPQYRPRARAATAGCAGDISAPSTPEQFAALLHSESTRYSKVVKGAGIRAG